MTVPREHQNLSRHDATPAVAQPLSSSCCTPDTIHNFSLLKFLPMLAWREIRFACSCVYARASVSTHDLPAHHPYFSGGASTPNHRFQIPNSAPSSLGRLSSAPMASRLRPDASGLLPSRPAAISFRVSCCVRGVVSWDKQNRDGTRRQTVLRNGRANSEQLFGRYGPTNRRSCCRSLRASLSAARSTSSTVSASRRPTWCSRCFAKRSTEYPRGVWYGSQGPQRKGCRRPRADNRSLVEHSSRLVLFISGGGLGIQEPGSMCGQGRARDRVMCPAVTRSIRAGAV